MKGLSFHKTELTVQRAGKLETVSTYMVFEEDFVNLFVENYPGVPVPLAFVQEILVDGSPKPTTFIRYSAGNGGKAYYHPYFAGLVRQGDIRSVNLEESQALIGKAGVPADVEAFLKNSNIADFRIGKSVYNPAKGNTAKPKKEESIEDILGTIQS